mgnify:CR=1 FL=1
MKPLIVLALLIGAAAGVMVAQNAKGPQPPAKVTYMSAEQIAEALATTPNLVIVAPPGAGKTTRAPLVLMHEEWAKGGKLILLEPRRLAARAAASARRLCLCHVSPRMVNPTAGHNVLEASCRPRFWSCR